MAKRGERATHRVCFKWASGISGSTPCYWDGQTAYVLEQLRTASRLRGVSVSATVLRRDGAAWIEAERHDIAPDSDSS